VLTSSLISALKHSESPRIVRAIDWALEKRTGFSAKSQVIGSMATGAGNWHEDHGFYKIARKLYGSGNHAGVTVNELTALESSAVYACVKIIAEDMGSLPWNTYQRSRDRKSVDLATDHPLFRTLKNLVNPETSSGEFVEALTSHALLCGNGFARIERKMQSIFLWQWQPEDVTIDYDNAGKIVYIYKQGTSAEKTYERREVFHLKGFTLNGNSGDQIIIRARHILGLTLAAQEYAGRFFAQDATPGLVITRPMLQAGQAPWDPETIKKIKSAWVQWHRGLKNAHEPAILQDGADVKTLQPTHEQSQLIQQRKFQVIEVARMLRVPLFKLAELDRAIQANAEQQAIEYLFCLSPWVERWKRTVHRCLLTLDEQLDDLIYAEHDTKILLRADFRSQAEGFRSLLEKGVYNIDEVRRWLNMNPLPNGAGQNHFIQLNMGTVQDVATGATLAKNETGTMPASGVRD
jgi:HK97 family phage portal protein